MKKKWTTRDLFYGYMECGLVHDINLAINWMSILLRGYS